MAAVSAAAIGRLAPVRLSRLSGATMLSLSTVLSGALTYAFLVVAARALGADGYGLIGVLWAAMFVLAIVVFRPIEQTTSQAIAARLAVGQSAAPVVRTMTAVAVAVAAMSTIVLFAGWRPIDAGLFESSPMLMVALIVGVTAYGLSYLVRGVVGGIRWFGGYAIVLVVDGAVRLAVALPLVLVNSRTLAAAAVVAAGAGGAIAPLVLGRSRIRRGLGAASGSDPRFSLAGAAAFAAPAALIAASDQMLVNGAPLLAAVAGASRAQIGVVFAATMLVRAPVYVFQGFAASLLPNLTHLAESRGRAALRGAVLRTAAVLVGCGLALIAAAATAGPAAMRVIYGSTFAASRWPLALLAAGVACYLAAGTFSQALLAVRRGPDAAWRWLLAVGVFVGAFAVSPGDPLLRASIGLGLGSLTAAIALGHALSRTPQ